MLSLLCASIAALFSASSAASMASLHLAFSCSIIDSAASSENLDSSNLRSSSILQRFSSVAYVHTILEPTGNLTSARRKHEFSVPSVLL